ncbi:hypothetical protein [Streptomyces edwardsiae]|uniref:Uncharacterized protein n=1 Tax=Streptomyces edwardsiae TaxID=3075527 RepID=A0ABU2PYJ4_9ACTN|nr:hypothetical protein [Streptomyces sp. DSM 41636]MDT0397236.1 hypothetical protein [Streptomyces sp. DSM 41636]
MRVERRSQRCSAQGRDAEILALGAECHRESRDPHREAAPLRFLGSAALVSTADVRTDLSEREELTCSVGAFLDGARSHEL